VHGLQTSAEPFANVAAPRPITERHEQEKITIQIKENTKHKEKGIVIPATGLGGL
jgi:hypothetical protein